MHLKALTVFCDVVRHRSFSRAAEENEISQSAASQIVQQLEQRLQTKLIDRSRRPFVLTPEGKKYYEGCRGLVERYLALEDEVRSLHREVAGRVRLASIYSIGLHHMNAYIQRFLTRYPAANVRLEYLHPNRVYQAVERETADIGLVSYPRTTRAVKAMAWREEPMVLVCAPSHPLAGRDRVQLRELSGLKMVNFDKGLSIRRELDRVLHRRHVEVETAMEFDNIETLKRAVEIDAGVALLPEPTVQREIAAGTLVATPVADERLVRPIGILTRRGAKLATAAAKFIELLRHDNGWDGQDGKAIEEDRAAGDLLNGREAAGSQANGRARQKRQRASIEPPGLPGAPAHCGKAHSAATPAGERIR